MPSSGTPERWVLDAFALVALFQHEPGGARVLELLERAAAGECELYISVLNLGEILYTVERRRGVEAAQRALAYIDGSSLRVIDIHRELALKAARLKASSGLGYLDCFVAALAQRLGATLVTGDRDFQRVEGPVAIEWLPGREGR